MEPLPAADLDAALAALRRGEPIGLPTETVYGLAADAMNPAAVARIYALKGRPADHPVIVHLAALAQLEHWARRIPPYAVALAEAFWPGPLTLILPKRSAVGPWVTGGQDNVGLRIPAHPVALAVLRAFGGGLAAPSANRYGGISPTRAEHVRSEFGAELPLVLDGGACPIGIESSIVDCTGPRPRLLRPGQLGAERLAAVAGPWAESDAPAPRAPGDRARHYAPRTPMKLVDRAGLIGPETVALALDTLPPGVPGLCLPSDPEAYGRGLYAALRSLDAQGARTIRVERPPIGPDWQAIHDRLGRAAADAAGR